MIANVTTSGSVIARKYHIDFILSTDFTGTIGAVTIPPSLGVYSPGNAPRGTLSSSSCVMLVRISMKRSP
jgi:hypothetical protein